jgi:poly(3-hydroxyalkanoate) synthetase
MPASSVWPHSPWTALARLHSHALRTATATHTEMVKAATQFGCQALANPLSTAGWPTAWLRWLGHVASRQVPEWASPHETVFATPLARLLDFSHGAEDSDVTPTLVLPPQAGHSSTIVDYSREQSQIATIRAAGLERAFALEWAPATRETRDTTVEDYIEVVRQAIARAGRPVNLIGDCQGGWLAAIYAALHPEDVHTLTLAGAPIDFHAGDSAIAAHTQLATTMFGMAPYRALVAAGGGTMPGAAVLAGFIAIRPEAELAKHLQLSTHLNNDDHLARYHAFEDWFKHTQNIPGAFYLWLVEHLFRSNELISADLHVGGRRVELANIRCPLYLLAGAADHITPPDQVFAAGAAVGTNASDIVYRTAPGGHLGLFMGREALREHWSILLADIHARSRRHTEPPADRRAAREETPPHPEDPPMPAP